MKRVVFIIMLVLLPFVHGEIISCYQESANVSTACGGLDTGNYATDDNGVTFTNLHNYFDENWSSTAYLGAGTYGSHLNITMNYTTPIKTESAVWKYRWFSSNYSVNIPADCVRNNLLLRYQFILQGPSLQDANYTCYNGTLWLPLAFVNSTLSDDIYEEGVTWSIVNDSCMYSGTGNWIIERNDNCSITRNASLNNNYIIFNGSNSGYTIITATLTNVTGIIVQNNASVQLLNNGQISR